MTGREETPGRRVMALDPGQKRIGVAISDPGGSLALPLATVEATPRAKAVERIMALIREQGATELVVGLPLNMDGSRGPQAEKCEAFARLLAEASGLPVTLHDERLTTVWAERSLAEGNVRGPRKRRVVDRVAAVLLLQGYLRQREIPP